MFLIKIESYSNDSTAEVRLDLDIQHKDPKLFHIKFTVVKGLVLEEGFGIKDADQYPHENLKIISNTLFSENEILKLQKNRYFDAPADGSELMQTLFDALREFLAETIWNIEVKVHIPTDKLQAQI